MPQVIRSNYSPSTWHNAAETTFRLRLASLISPSSGRGFFSEARERYFPAGVGFNDGLMEPKLMESCRYRGYEIVPQRQWSQWCVSVYATRADLPLLSSSTLRTLTPQKDDAVAEAKQSIDRILSRLENWRT
jgi:hypothetical protein